MGNRKNYNGNQARNKEERVGSAEMAGANSVYGLLNGLEAVCGNAEGGLLPLFSRF